MRLSEICQTAHIVEPAQSCTDSNKAERADQTTLCLDAKVLNCFVMK
jgi:hypothetical protein